MLIIKELLKQKGITQIELAKKIGITPSALLQSITGNTSVSRLKELADALNVSIGELFESTSKKELTALVSYKGEFFKANTLEELEEVVSKIKQL